MKPHEYLIFRCGAARAVIRCRDTAAAQLLAGMPDFIPAVSVEPDMTRCRVHLSVCCAETLSGASQLSERDGCGFYWDAAAGKLIFRIFPRKYDFSRLTLLWCYISCGAVYSAIVHGEKLFMLHGGMSERPDGGAAVWFGCSGIGKSTLASRLASVGIRAPADDALLLAPYDGGFVVRPLPTWSRAIAMAGGGAPDIPELPLRKLLLLDRNPTASEVREISRLSFHARLFGAVSAHSLFMMRISPPELSFIAKQRLFVVAAELAEKFPPHVLFAALNDTGTIADILSS